MKFYIEGSQGIPGQIGEIVGTVQDQVMGDLGYQVRMEDGSIQAVCPGLIHPLPNPPLPWMIDYQGIKEHPAGGVLMDLAGSFIEEEGQEPFLQMIAKRPTLAQAIAIQSGREVTREGGGPFLVDGVPAGARFDLAWMKATNQAPDLEFLEDLPTDLGRILARHVSQKKGTVLDVLLSTSYPETFSQLVGKRIREEIERSGYQSIEDFWLDAARLMGKNVAGMTITNPRKARQVDPSQLGFAMPFQLQPAPPVKPTEFRARGTTEKPATRPSFEELARAEREKRRAQAGFFGDPRFAPLPGQQKLFNPIYNRALLPSQYEIMQVVRKLSDRGEKNITLERIALEAERTSKDSKKIIDQLVKEQNLIKEGKNYILPPWDLYSEEEINRQFGGEARLVFDETKQAINLLESVATPAAIDSLPKDQRFDVRDLLEISNYRKQKIGRFLREGAFVEAQEESEKLLGAARGALSLFGFEEPAEEELLTSEEMQEIEKAVATELKKAGYVPPKGSGWLFQPAIGKRGPKAQLGLFNPFSPEEMEEREEYQRELERAYSEILQEEEDRARHEEREEYQKELAKAYAAIIEEEGMKNPLSFPALGERPGLEVQSVLFPKKDWDKFEVRSWLAGHGMKAPAIDAGGPRAKFFRARQQQPKEFVPGTERTIKLGRGIKAVVGVPKEKLQEIVINPKRRTTSPSQLGLPFGVEHKPLFSVSQPIQQQQVSQEIRPNLPGKMKIFEGDEVIDRFFKGSRYSFESTVGGSAVESDEKPYLVFYADPGSKMVKKYAFYASPELRNATLEYAVENDLYQSTESLKNLEKLGVVINPRSNPPVRMIVQGIRPEPFEAIFETKTGEVVSSPEFPAMEGAIMGVGSSMIGALEAQKVQEGTKDFTSAEQAWNQFEDWNTALGSRLYGERGNVASYITEVDPTGTRFEGIKERYERRKPITSMEEAVKYIIRKEGVRRWEDFPLWLFSEIYDHDWLQVPPLEMTSPEKFQKLMEFQEWGNVDPSYIEQIREEGEKNFDLLWRTKQLSEMLKGAIDPARFKNFTDFWGEAAKQGITEDQFDEFVQVLEQEGGLGKVLPRAAQIERAMSGILSFEEQPQPLSISEALQDYEMEEDVPF